uniref:Uncharacterized protein n=1 Tax=Glossina austeni TaxID=7395 RepID=A0A1A9UM93_GLOAU
MFPFFFNFFNIFIICVNITSRVYGFDMSLSRKCFTNIFNVLTRNFLRTTAKARNGKKLRVIFWPEVLAVVSLLCIFYAHYRAFINKFFPLIESFLEVPVKFRYNTVSD